MRVFAIKDESISKDKVLAYLIYYENAKNFYIELPEEADPWEVPLLLSSFVERNEYSINPYYSNLWVKQRVIPADRQNIGSILKENGLKEYDEFSLLLLSEGRCAQDDCYIEEIKTIPELLIERWKHKIEDVVPLQNEWLLLFFRSGEVKIVDMHQLIDRHPACSAYLKDKERFNKVEIQTDGHGIFWNEKAMISDLELYEKGISIPLSQNDFFNYVKYRIISTSEACEILNCSRQNIDDLVKRDKLHPIKTSARNKLFLRNEVMQRAHKKD